MLPQPTALYAHKNPATHRRQDHCVANLQKSTIQLNKDDRTSKETAVKMPALGLCALLLVGMAAFSAPSYAQSDQLGSPGRDGDDDSFAKNPGRKNDATGSPARDEPMADRPARERERGHERDHDNLSSDRDNRERDRGRVR
jgi:hypothetical protein